MDVELCDRLVEWLTFFLSQQDFGWDWESWAFVSQLENWDPRKVFVRNLLTRCSNLTDLRSFQDMLPDELVDLMGSNKRGIFKIVRIRLASQNTRACRSEFASMMRIAPTNWACIIHQVPIIFHSRKLTKA